MDPASARRGPQCPPGSLLPAAKLRVGSTPLWRVCRRGQIIFTAFLGNRIIRTRPHREHLLRRSVLRFARGPNGITRAYPAPPTEEFDRKPNHDHRQSDQEHEQRRALNPGDQRDREA